MSPARALPRRSANDDEVPKLIQKNWEELIKPNKLEINSGHDAQRIAERQAETALERLGDDRRKPGRIPARNNIELGGLDEILPVLLQHRLSPFLIVERGILPRNPNVFVQH